MHTYDNLFKKIVMKIIENKKSLSFIIILFSFFFIPSCITVDFSTTKQSSIAQTRVFVYSENGIMRYQGTAFAIDDDRLLTAGHLCQIELNEILQKIEIQSIKNGYLIPGEIRTAEIINIHPTTDVCLLKSTDHKLKPVRLLPDLSIVDSGAEIVTEGCPAGKSYYKADGWLLTKEPEWLVMMLDVHPGQSGSPVLWRDLVIGMVVSYDRNFRDISYAISAEFLYKYLKELENGER